MSARSELRSAETHWRATENRRRQHRVEKVKNDLFALLLSGAIGTVFGAAICFLILRSH